MQQKIQSALEKTKVASHKLIQLSDDEIKGILNELADLTLKNIAFILEANEKDLNRMTIDNPKYDRLLLDEGRLTAIIADLRKVASLPSPLEHRLEERVLPNGLSLSRISVPMGVIGIIYESRPNVTFDVFALCLKSGNASVLKGSRDAHYSNLAIVKLIHKILAKYNLQDACFLLPSEREALPYILEARNYVDLIIPRGSQGLIDFVRNHAKVPVIETGAGIVHTYMDETADTIKSREIVMNAKSRRVSVCNALDTLLVHIDQLRNLPFVVKELGAKHNCEIYADQQAHEVLKGRYNKQLLHRAKDDSFGTEFLSMQMSIKTVRSLDDALIHISKYSSKHSEAIISENDGNINRFLKEVDAAVVYSNASTAFTDGGEFGMGAEIGISTQKLHARGPMALRALTSYKWLVKGEGQTRE